MAVDMHQSRLVLSVLSGLLRGQHTSELGALMSVAEEAVCRGTVLGQASTRSGPQTRWISHVSCMLARFHHTYAFVSKALAARQFAIER